MIGIPIAIGVLIGTIQYTAFRHMTRKYGMQEGPLMVYTLITVVLVLINLYLIIKLA